MVLSATDLSNHLACGHLTQSQLGIVRRERPKAQRSQSAHADLLRDRGDAHEREQLAKLEVACGAAAVDLARPTKDADGKWLPETRTRAWIEAGAAATEAAMRAGHPLIFQASFFDGRWQGVTDFLRRVDLAGAPDDATRAAIERSELGDYAYEVLDTKLARKVKPSMVHQLLLYSRLVERVQGTELPRATIITGNGVHESIELDRYRALHDRVVRRYEALVAAPTDPHTYPEPVAHCPICSMSAECERRLRGDDHLSLVANARRVQRELLVDLGLPTVASLAGVQRDEGSGALAAADGRALEVAELKQLGDDRFAVLRSQAALQVESRTTKQPVRKVLEPQRRAGLALLPPPDPADIFFDLEGDPYVESEGVEYLWGWSAAGVDGEYEHEWAHTEAEERRALERFVDHVVAQRTLHPGLHVYHYAPHEKSKLLTLSVKYGTREREIDELVGGGVLIDLYAVVGRALQVGEESYSLKKLERHHGFVRQERRVSEGGGSIAVYEDWLKDQENIELLEAIRAYNEEDCRSTWSLREWLWGEVLPEAQAAWPEQDWALLRAPIREDDGYVAPAWVSDVEAVVERLQDGLFPRAEAERDSVAEAERRLAGDLLFYLRREQKPEWWRYFDLKGADAVKLIDEREALGGLVRDSSVPPIPVMQSFDLTFSFPPQDFKEPLSVIDPATEKEVNLVRVDPASSTAVIRRGKKALDDPLPSSLVPAQPLDATEQRRAIEAVADVVLGGPGRAASPIAHNAGALAKQAEKTIWRPAGEHGRFAAVRALLRREPPRLAGGVELGESTEELVAGVLALDHSVLAVQGPPGTGKTYNAARMIVAALKAGKRVGISAQSHAGIRNLLRAVEEHAMATQSAFRGAYKARHEDDYASLSGWVSVETKNDPIDTDLPQLVAGTAWFFAREHLRRPEPAFDLIFIDEAGQFSLAQAIAVGTSARSLVLLGDPQQLPQVTQADHPGGSGASVLEHVLDGAPTMPAGRGVMLSETWRMHPSVTGFVSGHSYEGKLRSVADCERRAVRRPSVVGADLAAGDAPDGVAAGVSLGAGIRTIEVEHAGCSQWSQEEADRIAAACRDLLDGGTVTEPLRDAPRAIARAVEAGALVGAAGEKPALPPGVEFADGMVTRPLRPSDLLVVAPYNLAVQRIAATVPKGVRVGTVDKIQGQEAPVVFYALTCSSSEDVPRGLDFLFDKNRLNVAVSRAQCLAVLVHSPRLLDADCRTLEAMAAVSGVCGLAEAGGRPE